MDDPRVRWQLANPHGILNDASLDTWWSGRVFDILQLDNGDSGLLLATETGGVWSLDTAGGAIPLSNTWNSPDVNCLAPGPDGSRHFFAGCDGGVIFETDASNSLPLLAWAPVADPLPDGAGDVFDLVVIRRHRIIVAACSGGLFWSNIPATPPWWCLLAKLSPGGGTRPPYKWNKAVAQDVGQGGYFTVAIGSRGRTQLAGEEDLSTLALVAGASTGGVLVGGWSGGVLRLKRPTLRLPTGEEVTDLAFAFTTGPSSVASSEQHPRVLFAACAQLDGTLQMVIRSADGGASWVTTKYDINVAGAIQDFRPLAGAQGAGGAPNNCIAVHPTMPSLVAIGWQYGVFLSPTNGDIWFQTNPHHSDLHVLLFTATTPDDKHLLYLGSDGGLAQIDTGDVIGMKPVAARSDYNRNLATMQFYSTWVTRQFYGTMSPAGDASGRFAAGVHDNGNLSCDLQAGPSPWRQINSGDGGWTGIVKDGGLISNIKGNAARVAQPYGVGFFLDKGIIPIALPLPPDPNGLVSPIADVVRHPSFRNRYGQPMYAAGGSFGAPGAVHGAFNDGPEQTYHWEQLGIVPFGLGVSAAASYSGSTVMVGAGAGRIFALDSKQGTFLELPVVLPNPAPATPQTGGGIPRIVMLTETIGFAILNSTNIGANYILRLDGLKWVVPLLSGLPINAAFYGLDGYVNGTNVILFAATDDRVYLSLDRGENWVQASLDLPRRPHCADLRVGTIGTQRLIFLGTFGRSLWSANVSQLLG